MTTTAKSRCMNDESPRLQRELTLRDLMLYGVVIMSPVGSMSFFGVLSQRGHGHAASMILIGMCVMLLTAISYGRMASAYPSAGSAFSYVGQELTPALGYVVGWSMVMDYLLNPLICVMWCSQQGHVFFPSIPYWTWVILFAGLMTGMAIQGIRISARVNLLLAAGMGLVVAIFLAAAALYVFRHPHSGAGFFTRPFYDPKTWTPSGIVGGTSLAVLVYMGFDGVSTLAEEAKTPHRDILNATVLACVVIGLIAALEVYAAQLVWPMTQQFADLDTAFTFVARRAWTPLFGVVGATLIVAFVGSGLAAQLGAARLLYAMGRSGALPRGVFGVLETRRGIPRNSVLFVGAIALAGAIVLPAVATHATGFELGANLLNFGALIAFMGVNAAAFVRYYVRAVRGTFINFIRPALGFLVCLLLWWNLNTQAWVFGAIWLAIGISYGVWRTRGFRTDLVIFEVPPEVVPQPPRPGRSAPAAHRSIP